MVFPLLIRREDVERALPVFYAERSPLGMTRAREILAASLTFLERVGQSKAREDGRVGDRPRRAALSPQRRGLQLSLSPQPSPNSRCQHSTQ
jgi:hypothetical protein